MKPIQELNPITLRIIQLLELCSSPSHIHQIQAQLIIHRLHYDTRVAFHFINACHSQTLLSSAFSLFTQIPEPHVFICNNLLKAFSHAHMFNYSVSLYSHMNRNSISPNNYTFPFLLKSLSDKPDFKLGQPVHAQVVKTGHFYDIYVQNALLNLYASCGGRMEMCHKVFDEMPKRDVVSWTVLIAGNRAAGRFDEALIAFQQMQYAGVEPNRVTMVNALAACAGLGALEMGVWIHDCVRKNGWELDVILGTALIDMYGTCGKIEEGMKVFKMMNNKNPFTWNALIKGLALAKSGEEVVIWFFQMEREAIKPDEVTLITVLNACSQSGLVDIGREIFSLLVNGKYGFAPGAKHYSCMIDLLARVGFLKDARDLMEIMPCEPTNVMWGALLAGCRVHKNYELSEFVAWKLVEMEPENSAHYVVLSNLYAEMGRWADVSKVRGLMEERELMKAFEVNDLKYVTPLLLVNGFIDFIKFPSELPTQNVRMVDYIGALCFDLGGGSLLLVDNSIRIKLTDITNVFEISLFSIDVNEPDPFAIEFDHDKGDTGLLNLVLGIDLFGSVACMKVFCFDPGGEETLSAFDDFDRCCTGIKLSNGAAELLAYDYDFVRVEVIMLNYKMSFSLTHLIQGLISVGVVTVAAVHGHH